MAWIFLAFGAAIAQSLTQVTTKLASLKVKLPKTAMYFFTMTISSSALFCVSFLIIGRPVIDNRFWLSVSITALFNLIAFPIMLKAYEIGEFSSVYSMLLATPIFLVLTSFIFLHEKATIIGIIGIVLTIAGLFITSKKQEKTAEARNRIMGNLLALLVAFIWSISINFDKLAAGYSNAFFSQATSNGFMALGYGGLFLAATVKNKISAKNKELSIANPVVAAKEIFGKNGIYLIILWGLAMALANSFHSSALLAGPASYTMAIKRTGVLIGVFWGWFIFKEKDTFKKTIGVLLAVAGVIMILFQN